MDVIVIALIIVFAIWATKTSSRRRGEYRKAVESMGFSYFPNGSSLLHSRLSDFQLFNDESEREIRELIQRDYGSLKISLFEWAETGRGSRRHVDEVVALFSPDIQCPEFLIRPETYGDKFQKMVGTQDINIETHPDFSSKFFLEGSDDWQVKNYLSGEMLDFFCSCPNIYMEARAGALIFCRANRERYIRRKSKVPKSFSPKGMENWLSEGYGQRAYYLEFVCPPDQVKGRFQNAVDIYQIMVPGSAVSRVADARRFSEKENPDHPGLMDEEGGLWQSDQLVPSKNDQHRNDGERIDTEAMEDQEDDVDRKNQEEELDFPSTIIGLGGVASLFYGFYAIPCWLLSLCGFDPWGWNSIPPWAHYTLVLVIPVIGLIWAYATGDQEADLEAEEEARRIEEMQYGKEQLLKEEWRTGHVAWLIAISFFYGCYAILCWLLSLCGFDPWLWNRIPMWMHIILVIVIPVVCMVWLSVLLNIQERERNAICLRKSESSDHEQQIVS